jgi:hypothetical protein
MSSPPAADGDSPGLSPSDVRRVAKKALLFQRHIFRKAWGIYFSLWACAFTIYIFVPPLLQTLGVPSAFVNGYPLVAADLAVSVILGLASGRMLERARRSAFVYRAFLSAHSLFDRKWFVAWWIAYFVGIIAASIFSSAHLLSVVFGLGTSVTALFYYTLRSSFPEELPTEGKLAIFFFGFATTASFVLSFFPTNYFAYGIVWGANILVWFGASLVLLLHSDKAFAEETEVPDR